MVVRSGSGRVALEPMLFNSPTATVRIALNGVAPAGYRAGVVLGENTLVDGDLARGLLIATFDAAGNVLETATTSSLLAVNLLPNNRGHHGSYLFDRGRQVLRQQAVRSGQQDATLSTQGLPAGIYQVVLRNAGGQALGTQRLVLTN